MVLTPVDAAKKIQIFLSKFFKEFWLNFTSPEYLPPEIQPRQPQ